MLTPPTALANLPGLLSILKYYKGCSSSLATLALHYTYNNAFTNIL